MILLTIKRNFGYVTNFKIIIFQILLISFSYFIFLYNLNYIENIHLDNLDSYLLSSFFPGYRYSYFEVIIFLLPLCGLFFTYGIIHNIELNQNKYYIFSRFKNLKKWFLGNLIFNVLYSSSFVLVSIIILSIINSFFFSYTHHMTFEKYLSLKLDNTHLLLRNSFILLAIIKIFILSLLLNFQFLINIITKKIYIGYILNIIFLIISITITNIKLSMLLPANYLIFIRLNEFNNILALVYILSLYLACTTLIYYFIIKKSLL